MNYVVVIPSIWHPYTNDCLLSCAMDNILVIDNTETNIGVAASWNIGLKEMIDENYDWCIFMSAAMRFGPEGGLDFIHHLKHYTNDSDAPFVEMNLVGWHLIAVSRQIVESIGYIDETYFSYFEDNDYAYRSFLHRGKFGWPRVDCDASLMMNGHAIKLAGVKGNTKRQTDYYQKKWGSYPGHESYKHPFNNHKLGLDYWKGQP